MPNEPLLTTRDLGEAENALRANLIKILAQSDQKLTYGHWVALQMISKSPTPLAPAQLSGQLAGAIKVEAGEVEKLLSELQSKDIIGVQDDVYALSANGQAVFGALSSQVQEVTAKAFAGLDPTDLMAAHRVVTSIAKRASELLAS